MFLGSKGLLSMSTLISGEKGFIFLLVKTLLVQAVSFAMDNTKGIILSPLDIALSTKYTFLTLLALY